MCELVVKADLLSDYFDSKQPRESVDLVLACRPSPSLATFAFRSREVRHLLLDLDPYGVTLMVTHWVCLIFLLRNLMLWHLVLV